MEHTREHSWVWPRPAEKSTLKPSTLCGCTTAGSPSIGVWRIFSPLCSSSAPGPPRQSVNDATKEPRCRSHVLCRKTQTSQNYSAQAAHPGVPYGKVGHDSINGHKMANAGSREGRSGRKGVNISSRSGGEFLQGPDTRTLYFFYPLGMVRFVARPRRRRRAERNPRPARDRWTRPGDLRDAVLRPRRLQRSQEA